MKSPQTLKQRGRRFFLGWLGGVSFFLVTIFAGIYISHEFPADTDYNLAIDFVSLRKLEYLARTESNTSLLPLDESEMNATMSFGEHAVSVKVSSIQEPFSEPDRNFLSLFVISDNDTHPYLLLSPSNFSKNYMAWTNDLSRTFANEMANAKLIQLKTNGMDARGLYKIELPAPEDLESITVNDALNDADFKFQFPNFVASISGKNDEDKIFWLSEILIYFRKDSAGKLKVSHFLPTLVREFYE